MSLTRGTPLLAVAGVVVVALGIAFLAAGLHEPADDQVTAADGVDAVIPPSVSPENEEDRSSSPIDSGNIKSPFQPVFDGRSDLLATAEFLLAVEGVESREYAAAVARIGEACEAAHSVAMAPKDKFGAYLPAHDAAMILAERCRRWIDDVDKLPEPRYEVSEIMARAINTTTATPEGFGELRVDSPVVRDAIRQIKGGRHASEFQEAMFVWFDAHPQSRASLISRNRLADDDLGLALTLGTRLLECEITASCGGRSFATLELCVHAGCSPDLSYQEAIRTSLPPRIAVAAFDIRNRLVQIRTDGAKDPRPGGP